MYSATSYAKKTDTNRKPATVLPRIAVELPGSLAQTRQNCGCAPNARRVRVSAAMNDSAKNAENPRNDATMMAIC